MDITAEEIRTLRYRMNWTQVEMASWLGCDVDNIAAWEHGEMPCELTIEEKSQLLIFRAQADANSEHVQRRAVADHLMARRQLSQIVDDDVVECLQKGELSPLNFR